MPTGATLDVCVEQVARLMAQNRELNERVIQETRINTVCNKYFIKHVVQFEFITTLYTHAIDSSKVGIYVHCDFFETLAT